MLLEVEPPLFLLRLCVARRLDMGACEVHPKRARQFERDMVAARAYRPAIRLLNRDDIGARHQSAFGQDSRRPFDVLAHETRPAFRSAESDAAQKASADEVRAGA